VALALMEVVLRAEAVEDLQAEEVTDTVALPPITSVN